MARDGVVSKTVAARWTEPTVVSTGDTGVGVI